MSRPQCAIDDCEHDAVTVLVTEGMGGGVKFVAICQEHLEEIRTRGEG